MELLREIGESWDGAQKREVATRTGQKENCSKRVRGVKVGWWQDSLLRKQATHPAIRNMNPIKQYWRVYHFGVFSIPVPPFTKGGTWWFRLPPHSVWLYINRISVATLSNEDIQSRKPFSRRLYELLLVRTSFLQQLMNSEIAPIARSWNDIGTYLLHVLFSVFGSGVFASLTVIPIREYTSKAIRATDETFQRTCSRIHGLCTI